MRHLSILIVEDNNVLAKQMEATLFERGYTASIVSRGEDAIIHMIKNPADLIIMDIHLKGELDGIETAKNILKQYNLPIIYITDNESDEYFDRAKLTLPKNYLPKPFTILQMIRAVDLIFFSDEKKLEDNDGLLRSICDRFVFICKNAGCYQKITIDDISVIQALGSYSLIYADALEYPIKVSINSNVLYQKINSPLIKKVHKSYYVNLTKVALIETNLLFVSTLKIPIGNNYKEILEYYQFLKR